MPTREPVSIDADVLAAAVRASISAGLREPQPRSAVTWVSPGEGAGPAPQTTGKARADRRHPLDVMAGSLGTGLPPSPPTLRGRLGRWLVHLSNRLNWWHSAQVRELATALIESVQRTESDLGDTTKRLQDAEDRLAVLSKYIAQIDLGSRNLRDRLSSVSAQTAELRRQLESLSAQSVQVGADRDDDDEAFRSFHQERFRGPREQITKRVSVYLPYIREAEAALDMGPIIDLGCGRGEWLEVLRDQGLPGKGVDCNRTNVEFCRSLGLDAAQGDAIQFLDSLPKAGSGCITAFHLIEHLPFGEILRLFRAVYRTLAPQGLFIVETPDPRSRVVSSVGFYLDPAHLAPLPSELIASAFEVSGFRRIRTVDLNPPDGDSANVASTDAAIGRDYSVIGVRE